MAHKEARVIGEKEKQKLDFVSKIVGAGFSLEFAMSVTYPDSKPSVVEPTVVN
jgi:hypothetical protein